MYNLKSKTDIPEFELSTENYTLIFSFMHQCIDFFVESQEKKYIYHNVETGIDIIYYLEYDKIKENIIIWNKDNLVEKLSLSISSKDPIVFYWDNQELQVRSLNGEILFILDKPFVKDNEDNKICKCNIEYEKISDYKYILNIKLNNNLLLSLKNSQFPLTIDPSILFFFDNSPAIFATNIYGPPVMGKDQISIYAFQGNNDQFPVNIFKGVQVIGTVPLYAHPLLLDTEEKYQSFINNRGLDTLDIYFTFITNRETSGSSTLNKKLLYDVIPENSSALISLNNEADFVGNIGRTSVYRGLWSVNKQALPHYSDGLHTINTRFIYSSILADIFFNLFVTSTRYASFLKFSINVINQIIEKYMYFKFAIYLSPINFTERMSTWRENRPEWEPEEPGNKVVHKYMLATNIWNVKKTTNILDFRFNFANKLENISELELTGFKLFLTKYSEINLVIDKIIDNKIIDINNKVIDRKIHLGLFNLNSEKPEFINIDEKNIVNYSVYYNNEFIPPKRPWPEINKNGGNFPINQFRYGFDFSTMGITLFDDNDVLDALQAGNYEISALIQADLLKNSNNGGQFYAFIRNHINSNHEDDEYKPKFALTFAKTETGWAYNAVQYETIPDILEGTIAWVNKLEPYDPEITNIEGKYINNDPPILASYKYQAFEQNVPIKTYILQFEFAIGPNEGDQIPSVFTGSGGSGINEIYNILGYNLGIKRSADIFAYGENEFVVKDEFIKIYVYKKNELGQTEGINGSIIEVISSPVQWDTYSQHTKYYAQIFNEDNIINGNGQDDYIYLRYQASLTYIGPGTGYPESLNDMQINLYEFSLELTYKIEISVIASATNILNSSDLPERFNYFNDEEESGMVNTELPVYNIDASQYDGEGNWTIIRYLDTEPYETKSKYSLAMIYYFDFVGTEVKDLDYITGIELVIQKQAYYDRYLDSEDEKKNFGVKDAFVKIGVQRYDWEVEDNPGTYKIAWAKENKAKVNDYWKSGYDANEDGLPDQADEQSVYGNETDNWGKLWDIDEITSFNEDKHSFMCAAIIIEMERGDESKPSLFACIDNVKMKIYGIKTTNIT